MISLHRFLLLLFLLANVTPSFAALYRTNVDQSGPPPGCFESPTYRTRVTNPANSGQIWDVVIMVNRWVDLGGWAGGYYTGPQPTGEVVRLLPGDQAWLWWARGYQSVGQSQVAGYNWAEYHTVNVSLLPDPVSHTVTANVTPAGAGSVTGAGNYTEGESATLRAYPTTGYRFDRWSGSVSGTANPRSLVVDGPKTVTARFAPLSYALNVSKQGNGTVTGAGTYNHGQVATLTATPASGWRFNRWSGAATGAATSVAVTMNGPKSVTASFVRITHSLVTLAGNGGRVSAGGTYAHGTNATVTAYPDPNYIFTGWSGDASGAADPLIVTMNRDRTVRANFAAVTHELSTAVQGQGSVSGAGTYAHGQAVSVTASPASGWQFSGFSGALTGSNPTGTVVMNGDRNVTATFVRDQFTLSTAADSGGRVSAGGTYAAGTRVNVTATPDSGYQFVGWSGDASGSANPLRVTMNRNRSVRAEFSPRSYPVTINVSPAGSGAASGAGSYRHGETATLDVTPTANWRFDRWSGDATGTNTPKSVTVDGPKVITAHFVRGTFSLTTQADAGGTVSPGGTYPGGSTATVTATPDAQHDFAGWSGDASGASPTVGILMDRPKTVRARFTLKQFTLTTTATAGGTVTPGGTYPIGSVVTVSANADANSRFLGWTGDANGTASSVAVTMTGPKSVQARFATKTAQTISFPAPTDTSSERADLPLTASASSGLPVSYVVLSGPATVSGSRLILTGPGPVNVQAQQSGNAEYLAAPPVTRSFNVVAPAIVKYAASSRTLLQAGENDGQAPVILERP